MRKRGQVSLAVSTFNCPRKTERVPFLPQSGLAGAIGLSTPQALRQVPTMGFAVFRRVFALGKRSRSLVREMQSQPRTDTKIILPAVGVVG